MSWKKLLCMAGAVLLCTGALMADTGKDPVPDGVFDKASLRADQTKPSTAALLPGIDEGFKVGGDRQCAHEICLVDSYGDGWNGGLVTVYVNGTPVLTDLTCAGAGPECFTFQADTGDSITTVYTEGSWGYENSYYIYDGNGTVICAAEGAYPLAPGNCDTTGYCGTAPTGACCVAGVCVATNTAAECDLLDGLWFEGEDCTTYVCPCADNIYWNGHYDEVNALSCERRTDGSLARWIVDDVFFPTNVTIEDLHFWNNDPIALLWTGNIDYIILTDNAGAPGTVVSEVWDVPATRVDTGVVIFGDPIWYYSAVGLTDFVAAGNYWVGMRVVQDVPAGGQGWWCTTAANGTAGIWLDYNGPWEPGYPGTFDEEYDVAFCITGQTSGTVSTGACCDDWTGDCTDAVEITDCPSPLRFAEDTLCDDLDPPCGALPGACCYYDGTCALTLEPDCVDGIWLGPGTSCDECPCIVTCPDGGVAEQEPCGDDTNGGCSASPPTEQFEPIACGETKCGTIWADASLRDLDWYEITVTEPTIFTFTAKAEFGTVGMLMGMAEQTAPGVPGCANTTGYLAPYVTAGECEEVSVTTECMPPGTYYFIVAAGDWGDLPCGSGNNDYWCTLACEPCTLPTGACCLETGDCLPDLTESECVVDNGGEYQGDDTVCDPNPCYQPIPGDNCSVPLTVTVPADLPYTDPNQVTCGRQDFYEDTCLGYYDGGEDVLYELTVTEAVDIEITLDPGTTTYTGVALDDSCPPDDTCLAMSTNSSATPHTTPCTHLEPGTYYVMVDTWPAPDCIPEFDLTINTCTLPTGACCVGTDCVATTTEFDCIDTYGGIWYEGEDCSTFVCPNVIEPGEDCDTAYVIPAVPFSGEFDNDLATADGPEGTCDKYYPTTNGLMQNDVWLVWTAVEDCYAVATVSAGYDVLMTVRDNCTDLTELYCADDGDTGEDEIIVFSAVAGTTYYFQIGDTGSYEGGGVTNFVLTCEATLLGACCNPDTGECTPDTLEADCDALYGPGNWIGGVGCDPNPCPQPPPANDLCDNATVIGAMPFSDLGVNYGDATPDIDVSCNSSSCLETNYGVWYTYTPDQDCTLTVSVTAAGYEDTVIAIFTGPDCDNLTEVLCSDPQSASYAAVGGTQYWILIGTWSCTSVPDETIDIAFDCIIPGAGDTCGDPLLIELGLADLPYVDTNYTCGRINDYADTCLGYYDSGEDIIYELTVTEAMDVDITLDPKGTTYSGIAIATDCPPVTCLDYSTNSASTAHAIECVHLDAGVYYIMVDTWASPDCIPDFDMTISECIPPIGACCLETGDCLPDLTESDCLAEGGVWQGEGTTCDPNPCHQPEPGDNCSVPLVVNVPGDLPFADVAQYTCGRVDFYDETCLGYYDGGEDIIYELVVNSTIEVQITLDPKSTTYTGIALDDNCPPDDTCIATSTNSSAGVHGIDCTVLEPGTYYIMVDTWPSPDCIPDFDLTIESCGYWCDFASDPDGPFAGAPDGAVDIWDFYFFLDTFGLCDGDPKYKPECDTDGDNCITSIDYQAFIQCYRDANPGKRLPVLTHEVSGQVQPGGNMAPGGAPQKAPPRP